MGFSYTPPSPKRKKLEEKEEELGGIRAVFLVQVPVFTGKKAYT